MCKRKEPMTKKEVQEALEFMDTLGGVPKGTNEQQALGQGGEFEERK